MPCLVQLIKPAAAGELSEAPWCVVPPRKVTAWPGMGAMTWERTLSASWTLMLRPSSQVLPARSPPWEVGRPTQPGPHPPQKAASVCLTGQGPPEAPLGVETHNFYVSRALWGLPGLLLVSSLFLC